MMRRRWAAGIVATAALAAVGCGDQGSDALKSRLDALDARLAQVDKRLGDVEKAAPDAGQVRDALGELERRIGGLETRLGGLETRVGELGATHAGPPPTAAGGASGAAGAANDAAAADQARARAMALSALGDEYRKKLADLQAARDSGATAQQLAAQRRELSQWFRDRRREILLGTAPPPATP
jgi:small-conductance mechanosensitive channel